MIMPKVRHKHDERWLDERFAELVGITGLNHGKAIAEKYSAVYEVEYELEATEHKKHNRARHEANSRLVKVIRGLKERPVKPT